MPIATTLVGVITAIASVFTALGILVTALTAWHKAQQLVVKVDEVHHIVNQQRTDMENYNRALIRALEVHQIAVPMDQSKKDVT